MNRVLYFGPKLIAGLFLLMVSGAIMAQANDPAAYVKPGIDLTVYKKVMVKPLNMDHVEVLKPVWEQDDPEEWTLEIEDYKLIQELFMSAMKEELQTKGGYKLVSDSAEDVLRIEVEVLSLTPYVKPGTGDDGDLVIETLGSGDLVFSAEFRDSVTRELLILVEGERPIGEKYRKPSTESHVKNLTFLFNRWGAKVRESLDGDLD